MSAALVAMLFLQAAATAPQRPPPSTTDMPGWSKTPSAAEMTVAYPPEALSANFAGVATIECTVDDRGGLKDCVVVSEAGPGFGALDQPGMSLVDGGGRCGAAEVGWAACISRTAASTTLMFPPRG